MPQIAALLLVLTGIGLHADPILTVPLFHQNDNAWKDTTLDNSKDTIGEFGCTLTSWTMLLNYEMSQAGIKDKDGNPISYTPAQMNTLLNNYRTTVNGVTYDGWNVPITDGKPDGSSTAQDIDKMLAAVKQDTQNRTADGKGLTLDKGKAEELKSGVETPADYKPFNDALNAGHPLVIRVLAFGEGGHTVVLTGKDKDGNWIINDPFDNGPATPTKLNAPDYRNKIYSYDWGVFKPGGPGDLPPDPFPLNPYLENTKLAASTPEPGTWKLAAIGVLLIYASRRARHQGSTGFSL
jgi:Papain-like cysteine protease AvrRpt2